MKNKKSYVYIGLPVLGMIFYLAYIRHSAIDMVYSDYIRLINSYLPDIWDPKKFFVPDLLTRIPVNYLERAVNVTVFGYSALPSTGYSVCCALEHRLVLSQATAIKKRSLTAGMR